MDEEGQAVEAKTENKEVLLFLKKLKDIWKNKI